MLIHILYFIAGIIVGGVAGVMTMCLCFMAGSNNREDGNE